MCPFWNLWYSSGSAAALTILLSESLKFCSFLLLAFLVFQKYFHAQYLGGCAVLRFMRNFLRKWSIFVVLRSSEPWSLYSSKVLTVWLIASWYYSFTITILLFQYCHVCFIGADMNLFVLARLIILCAKLLCTSDI